jgi:hypothetical protein
MLQDVKFAILLCAARVQFVKYPGDMAGRVLILIVIVILISLTQRL